MSWWIGVLAIALMMALCGSSEAGARPAGRPVIRKLGTLDCDMVETTPIVFQGRLYRFEYVRANHWANKTGK